MSVNANRLLLWQDSKIEATWRNSHVDE